MRTAAITAGRTRRARAELLERVVAGDDPQRALLAPLCEAPPGRPFVVAHLGQSLDGFIATSSGESRFVTGQANLLHLHRLRALCDAVVVGAGTVAADDPRLTTRLVAGPNPLRVVVDPRRRLSTDYRVFRDDESPSLVACGAALASPGERHGHAEVLGVPACDSGFDFRALLEMLDRRGCGTVLVEGGGVTVSAFVAAGLVDRLHVAVAPMILGDGRPGLRYRANGALAGLGLGAPQVFRMGDDVLLEWDLRRAPTSPPDLRDRPPALRPCS